MKFYEYQYFCCREDAFAPQDDVQKGHDRVGLPGERVETTSDLSLPLQPTLTLYAKSTASWPRRCDGVANVSSLKIAAAAKP